jgi:hypothetical protein
MSRSQFASPMTASREFLKAADESESQQAPPEATFKVGSVHDREEHDADRIADQVLARLAGEDAHAHIPTEGASEQAVVHRRSDPSATARVGAAGGSLDDNASAELSSAIGKGSPLPEGARRRMETGFGRPLHDIRIHTDARAANLAAGMSARAFTAGRDIFFGDGQFDTDSVEGQRTLAHEIAHTEQAGGVRRKLAGTAEALENQGGGPSTKGLRAKTNWDKLVDMVRAYEATEAKVTANGLTPQSVKLKRKSLVSKLSAVKTHISAWRKANNDANEKKKIEKAVEKDGQVDEDTRSKAERRSAVNQLEPRVNNELTLLKAPDPSGWINSMGGGSGSLTGNGESDRGAINEVHFVSHTDEKGNKSEGVFKAETQINTKYGTTTEKDIGISQIDPNYGARSLALYKLDQLFKAGVTAKVEFAVYKDGEGGSQMGTFMEKAKGKSAGKHTWVQTEQDQQDVEGAVSLDDPVLQQGLNKLQLLDAIAGQLDRHQGNYFVQTNDDGKVTGVTGIDLDMAFGKKMTTVGRESAKYEKVTGKDGKVGRKKVKEADAASTAQHFRGLPQYIDKEFGDRILQVNPSDIENALKGLLSKAEIKATVARFEEVRKAVEKASNDGTLVEKWDGNTAKLGQIDSKEMGHSFSRETYGHDIQFGAWANIKSFMQDEIPNMFARHPASSLDAYLRADPEVKTRVRQMILNEGLIDDVSHWAWDNNVNAAALPGFIDALLNAFVTPATIAQCGEIANIGQLGMILVEIFKKMQSWLPDYLELDKMSRDFDKNYA